MLTQQFRKLIIDTMTGVSEKEPNDRMIQLKMHILTEDSAESEEEYYEILFEKANDLGISDSEFLLTLLNALVEEIDEEEEEEAD